MNTPATIYPALKFKLRPSIKPRTHAVIVELNSSKKKAITSEALPLNAIRFPMGLGYTLAASIKFMAPLHARKPTNSFVAVYNPKTG